MILHFANKKLSQTISPSPIQIFSCEYRFQQVFRFGGLEALDDDEVQIASSVNTEAAIVQTLAFFKMNISCLLVLLFAFAATIEAGSNVSELQERSSFSPTALQFDYPEVRVICLFCNSGFGLVARTSLFTAANHILSLGL